MPYSNPQALVSPKWVMDHIDAPDVRIVDATSFLPNVDRDAKAEFAAQHIPGSVFFDIDDIKDPHAPLPHMLPPAEVFSSKVRKLGLGDGIRVIAYDTNGGASASARVWWMFRCFGHTDVAILDGGLPNWLAQGGEVTDEPTRPRERHFTPRVDNTLVRSREQMMRNIDTGRDQVIDVRAAARFDGTAPEPRPGAKSGHMPESLNIPYMDLCDKENHFRMKDGEALKAIFDAAGVDRKKTLVTSCGSGVTACYVALALYLVGKDDVAIYDGSWAEWGTHPDTPVVT